MVTATMHPSRRCSRSGWLIGARPHPVSPLAISVTATGYPIGRLQKLPAGAIAVDAHIPWSTDGTGPIAVAAYSVLAAVGTR